MVACNCRSSLTVCRRSASATACRARARSRRATAHFRSTSDRRSALPSSLATQWRYTLMIGPGRQTAASSRFLRSRSASDRLLRHRAPADGQSSSRGHARPVGRTSSSRRGTQPAAQCSDPDPASRSPTGPVRREWCRRSAVAAESGRCKRGRRWIASRRCWPTSRCATTT